MIKTASSSTNLPPIESAALAKALRDPKVEGLARSLNLNLSDPATLHNLLSRTRQTIESSTQVTLSVESMAQKPAVSPAMFAPQSPYVRHALRTYQSIDAMK
jgi:hypothetical protein